MVVDRFFPFRGFWLRYGCRSDFVVLDLEQFHSRLVEHALNQPLASIVKDVCKFELIGCKPCKKQRPG